MYPFVDLAIPDLSSLQELRLEVRRFIADFKTRQGVDEWLESWEGFSEAFSRAVGARGWIGVTWPKKYGGQERTFLERHAIVEELLAAGAPVAAHWIADRQTGPHLLKYGTVEQCERFLPRISSGTCYFCIGMSEPDAGSDLSAIRTWADRVPGGWKIRGTKLWTTYAHLSHYMLALCRTSRDPQDRHAGFSQFIIDLQSEGVQIRSIKNLAGEAHFCEVVFEDAFVPAQNLVGEEGSGWQQVLSELAFERSGPDRFMSLHRLLERLVTHVRKNPDAAAVAAIGRLAAGLWTLRQLSAAVAGQLERGQAPDLEAALIKDLGTRFEQDLPETVRQILEASGGETAEPLLRDLQRYAVLHAPSFSIRGGTREIMRGIIARRLGLR